MDCYSSHGIINRISLYTIHGRTQVPIQISTIVHGLLQWGRVCNLVRPSPSAKLSDNSVVKEWNSPNQATWSSPISSPSQRNTQGWTDGNGVENWKMVAQLCNIAFAAQDHSEIHGIIAVQRDNWNKLCLHSQWWCRRIYVLGQQVPTLTARWRAMYTISLLQDTG